MFQNLIDNAIKYGADNSVVTVKAQLCSGFPKKSDKYFSDIRQVVLISVHNTGNPIAPHNIPRLFERFYRVDKARSREAGGTGLGLSIVREMVKRRKGTITAANRVEGGAIFTVCWPDAGKEGRA